MPRRRRVALSFLYLIALAVALAFADVGLAATVGAMLLGWVLLASIEWTAWRGVPHYAAGLPPAWHAPHVPLPPPQPLEQLGYPEVERDDAATWIASAAVRAELLGEWPVALEGDEESWITPADTQPALVRFARHHVDPGVPETIKVPARPLRRRLPLSLREKQ
ncbi:MAG TPA: hypothetical protein VGL84_02430 [Gaiellaceae bacterium]